ncbi:MAG: thioredoxin domain-containing protein [Deltaproteobacteria bacterium]|nr:thioredoxin domain-containing protein [Deltaproteobacteria bacterium]
MKKIFLIIGSLSVIIFIGIMVRRGGLNKTDMKELLDTVSDTKQIDQKLLEAFDTKRKQLGSDYKPRTRHFDKEGEAQYTNRLFLETSPYLLQHAHNPVNWYPWGDHAFETAKKLKRPVLLSVGYSTCHWCHVMEEESFEDEEIAKVMNENYIAIKVDREERPDVDAIYMSAVQAMTGHGGWPMTVWLTPERKPFFGGTYFPARDGDRGTSTGFLTLLKRLEAVYHKEPDKVADATEQLITIVKDTLKPDVGLALPSEQVLHKAADFYKSRLDSTYGGLSGAPKFPSSLPIRFLLRYYRRTQDKKILNAATHTLKKMAAGGIYDHVGSGFHRYSTDSEWLTPHFEKMLYDNALLAVAYLEAYQVTGEAEFKRITQEILRYVKRDMTSLEGAFHSATDADSPNPKGHREEGWFFTWTPKEIDTVLESEDSKLVKEYYSVTPQGNFEGRTILNTSEPLSKISKKFKLSETEARQKIKEALEKLYQYRLKRPSPIRDEKILTAWNGLMISAYAQAGLILNENEYVESAKRAAQFILSNLYKDGRLFRSFKDGKTKFNAYLDDYAFFIAALLDLYEASSEIKWLKQAIQLDQTLEKYYEDKSGGFFMTSHDHEKLLARQKPAYDGAEPSGNSVALLNLLKLQEFTTKDSYRIRIEKALKVFSKTLESRPAALSEMLLAVDFFLDKPKEIIIVTPKGKREEAHLLLSELRKKFLPNKILVVVEEGEELKAQAQVIPLIKLKYAIQNKTTAYVCEKGMCELPTHQSNIFSKQISVVETLKETH